MAVNAPISSGIDVRLTLDPQGISDPNLYDELNGLYSAVSNLQSVVSPLGNNIIPIVVGGTIAFPNMSGLIIINNYATGSMAVFLASAGTTALIASIGTLYGTLAYTVGIKGYTWTNNYLGGTASIAFVTIKTRNTT